MAITLDQFTPNEPKNANPGDSKTIDLSQFTPIQKPGLLRSAGDTGLSIARGLTTGVKMVSDSFGANNAVSRGAGKIAEGIGGYRSDESKYLDTVGAQRMDAAEASGSKWNEFKAGVSNFADRPFDMLTEGVASSVPTIAAVALSRGRINPLVSGAGAGAVQGAGSVKGQIYDDVKARHIKAGLSEADADARAQEAQAYTGKSADQIALGMGLGALAGTTGAEGAVSRIIGHTGKTGIKPVIASGLAEGGTEFAQGGQERLAANIAAQREGFDTPTWQGVVGQGTMEGLAGAGSGGAFGVAEQMAGQPVAVVDPNAGAISRALSQHPDVAAPVIEPIAPIDPATTGQANYSSVVAQSAPMALGGAQDIAAAMNQQSTGAESYTVVPHGDAGFTVVPTEWMTDEQLASFAAIQGDGGRLEAPADPGQAPIRIDAQGNAIQETPEQAAEVEAMKQRYAEMGKPTPRGVNPNDTIQKAAELAISAGIQPIESGADNGATRPDLAGLAQAGDTGPGNLGEQGVPAALDMPAGSGVGGLAGNITPGVAGNLPAGTATSGADAVDRSGQIDLSISEIRRPNGAIGTQGVTEEQVRGVLTHAAGMSVPSDSTMRGMVEALRASPEAQQRLREFTAENPLQGYELPDGTIQIQDGHHRAFLLNQIGDATIPANIADYTGKSKSADSPGITESSPGAVADNPRTTNPVVANETPVDAPQTVIARIGATPNSAQPVTVRGGVVHIGEAATEIIVPEGATSAQVADALRANNAVAGDQKVYAGAKGMRQEKASKAATDATSDKPAIVEVKDVYGVTHRVSKTDLDGDRTRIPTFTKAGAKKDVIHRDNIDVTGDKQAEMAAEIVANPMFDVITAGDNKTFKTAIAAKAHATKNGYTATHDAVPASEVQAGMTGFILKKKQAQPERRTDNARRQAVAEMDVETLRRELLTDSLTGIGNRRAYDESEKLPAQVSIDADSLKWINDNLGHASGDKLLKAIGQALGGETSNAYHVSGDEFIVQAATEAEAQAIMDRAVARMADARIDATNTDGQDIVLTGVGVSYGIAGDLNEAEKRLGQHKAERETQGQRAARGETPPNAAIRGQRGEDQPDNAAAEAEVSKPAGADKPDRQDGWRDNAIKARKVMNDLGIERADSMKLADMLAAIDAHDAASTAKPKAAPKPRKPKVSALATKDPGEYGEAARRVLLQTIRKAGGVSIADAADITGETRVNSSRMSPGFFATGAPGIDLVARTLHEAGYITDAEYNDTDGGVQVARDLINNALRKQPVLTSEQHEHMAGLEALEADAHAELQDQSEQDMLADILVADLTDAEFTALHSGIPADEAADQTDAYRAAQQEQDDGQSADIEGKAGETQPGSTEARAQGSASQPQRAEGFDLAGQTPAELAAADKQAKQEAADKAAADAKAEAGAKADRERGDFSLTGSDRASDANAGQGDIFSQPAEKKSDSSLNKDSSWIIRNKETGEVVMETFDKAKVDALNTAKYEAVPIQEHLASLSKPSKTEAAPDKPVAALTPLEAHKDLFDRATDGKVAADEFKAAYAAMLANKDAITAELDGLTKAKLFERYPGLEYRYKNEKKADLIRAVYRSMMTSFTLSDSLSYGMGKNAMEDAVQAIVDKTTDQKMADYASEVQADIAERVARRKETMAGVEDPKTLKDFENLLSVNAAKLDGKPTFQQARMTLTPEQRAQFDILAAEKSRGERASRKDADRSQVQAAGATTGAEIVATKHTRDGYDLFVVKAAERVERDVYNQWLSAAKKIGGWYSPFAKGGAIPGFQFKDRESAEAFQKYVSAGDTQAVKDVAQTRRDAYADDRSQTAVERLTEMADRLEDKAEASLGHERKANTARRARFAASAEAAASAEKALAKTMRNLANAISGGKAQFLDRIRQKTQVEMLSGMIKTAHNDELRVKYPAYVDYERHQGEPATAETVDYVTFPGYTAFRSDLASLGRALLEVDGTKKLGQRMMKVADDVSDAYLKFAKENIDQVSGFRTKNGARAAFPSKAMAEAAIARSGYKGAAIVLPFKRNENHIIFSPSEAIKRGVWPGDNDTRITLTREFGDELVAAIGKVARRGAKVSVPWQFESAHDKRARLSAMGIETPAEMRAALREFISLKENTEAPSKIKELERAMIGRQKDGLDFFPTPAKIADEMVETAGIKPGMTVLEPSAGMGNIAERIREAGVEPDVVELANNRKELLEAKGFNVVGRDFMDVKPREFFTYGDTFKDKDGNEGVMRGLGGMGSNRVRLVVDGDERTALYVDRDDLTGVRKNGSESGYDRILMNPPFGDRRDAEHVQHAYELLRPGGRIVAIMGEGVFFGSDKKATAFRDWLEQMGGTDEKLDEGTFLDAGLPVNTGVNARMVVIDKPGELVAPVIDETDTGTAMFSRTPQFYSPLARAFDNAKQESMPAGMWKAWLNSNAAKLGLKKDEIAWSGIEEYLDLQGKAKVSKAEITDYLSESGVRVDDTVLSDESKQTENEIAHDAVKAYAEQRGLYFDDRGPDGYSYLIDEENDNETVYEGFIQDIANDAGLELDGTENPDGTKFAEYVPPGGIPGTYRETLVTLPEKDSTRITKLRGSMEYRQDDDGKWNVWDKDDWIFRVGFNTKAEVEEYAEGDEMLTETVQPSVFRSSHFDQKNILVHIRTDEVTGADGKRYLRVVEVQSDFGQQGKKHGFKTGDLPAGWELVKSNRSDAGWQVKKEDGALWNNGFEMFGDKKNALSVALSQIDREKVPAAPFVTDTRAWVALGIKRAIIQAAESGVDGVVFATGQQNADLYDLSKQVERVAITKTGGVWAVTAWNDGTRVISKDARTDADLAEIVGKDLAERAIKDGGGEYAGLDLKVGGEGMRQFYDTIVPSVANDVLKKLGGGKVGSVGVTGATKTKAIMRDGEFIGDFQARKKASDTSQQPGFQLTDAMRDHVAKGLPLFKKAVNSSGLTEAESVKRVVRVQNIVNAIKAKWANAPEVIVVADMQDTKVPQKVRDLDTQMKSKGATGEPRGFIVGGKVYIVAGQNKSVEDVITTLAHETLGHAGLRGLYGESLNPILRQIVNMRRADVDAKVKEYGFDPESDRDLLRAAEEVLAEMAQTRPEMGFVKRAIAAIRNWLRENGLNLNLTNADVIAKFILPARAYIENGEKPVGLGQSLQAAFSRNIGNVNDDQGSGKNVTDTNPKPESDVSEYMPRGSVGKVTVIQDNAPMYGSHAEQFFLMNDGRLFIDGQTVSPGEWLYAEKDDALNVRYFTRDRLPASVKEKFLRDYESRLSMQVERSSRINRKIAKRSAERPYDKNNPLGLFQDRGTDDWKKARYPEAFKNGDTNYSILRALEELDEGITAHSKEAVEDFVFNEHLEKYKGFRVGGYLHIEEGQSITREFVDAVMAYRGLGGKIGKTAAEAINSFLNPKDTHRGNGDDIMFSRTVELHAAVSQRAADLLTSQKTFNNWWHKTVGTQYHKAHIDADYRKAFNAVQSYLSGMSAFANSSADLADRLIPQLNSIRDLWNAKQPSQADIKAISDPIFTGTLTDEKVYGADELRDRFKLTPSQIDLYVQFRAAVDKSLDDLGKTDILRYAGKDAEHLRAEVLNAMTASRAAIKVAAHLNSIGKEDDAKVVMDKGMRVADLKEKGYAPLTRFGKYTLHVTDGDEQLYFSLFENESEANAMARQMKQDNPGATITQGVLSAESYKLFNGISPDTLELFAGALGVEKNELVQDYIKLAKNNRSAMKRLLKRKGIAGFSEDVPRILASFITSNSRQSASNVYGSQMDQAAEAIPREKGDVKDEAIKMIDFARNPTEDAAKLRGMLFVQYIGGSVASAMVNLTQPITMSYPYLHQFSKTAGVELAKAMKLATVGGILDPELKKALKRAEIDGVVSPQEIHQLQAEAVKKGAGIGALARMFGIKGGTANKLDDLSKRGLFAWGSLFSLAEQFNRRSTFIAAYNIARQNKHADPFAFAEHAVVETQGIYNRGNRPDWARGAPGAVIFTFKQYSISYMEFLSRLPPKEKAIALAIMVLAAGLQGIPFADDLDDLIDTLAQQMGYAWNTKAEKEKFAASILGRTGADFALHGTSALPGFPLDFSARLGMSNLLPGTGMLLKNKTDKMGEVLDVFGVAGGVVRDALRADSLDDVMPIAIRNVVKAIDMANTGMYRDWSGKKVVDTDGLDAATKLIGFHPADVAREGRAARMDMQDIQLARNIEAEIAGEMAQGIFTGDKKAVSEAREQLADWNAKNPDKPIVITSQQIMARVKKMAQTRRERLIQTAPKELRGGLVD